MFENKDWLDYFVVMSNNCLTMSFQVYEHVYETVDINSSPEVRANATAKVDLKDHRIHKYLTCAHAHV